MAYHDDEAIVKGGFGDPWNGEELAHLPDSSSTTIRGHVKREEK
jgi:hypothetical protein